MGETQVKLTRQDKQTVLFSNTASNMLSTIFPADERRTQAALRTITEDIKNPENVRKVSGFDEIYVARSSGMRIIFKKTGDAFVVTSIAAEG